MLQSSIFESSEPWKNERPFRLPDHPSFEKMILLYSFADLDSTKFCRCCSCHSYSVCPKFWRLAYSLKFLGLPLRILDSWKFPANPLPLVLLSAAGKMFWNRSWFLCYDISYCVGCVDPRRFFQIIMTFGSHIGHKTSRPSKSEFLFVHTV